jgi:hypothetical protein
MLEFLGKGTWHSAERGAWEGWLLRFAFSLDAPHQSRAFISQHGDVAVRYRPHQGVVDGRILARELVAEVDDASSARDGDEDIGCDTR